LRLGLPQIAATVTVQALAGLQVRSASPRRLSARLWLYIAGVLSAMTASLLGGRLVTLGIS
jgi:predicted benzoate:H+ symporter BenE